MDFAKFSGASDIDHEYNRTDVMRERNRESTHQLHRDGMERSRTLATSRFGSSVTEAPAFREAGLAFCPCSG